MRSALIVVALVAILAAAGFYAYAGLSESGDTSVGVHGWIAMFLGIDFVRLRRWPDALVFYSSRHGYDKPPSFATNDHLAGSLSVYSRPWS